MILREAFDYEFSRLDPTGAHIDPPSIAIYETLMVKGPDWDAHSMLAANWQVSEDKLEWRIHLRPNMNFHSGTPCNAAAVLDALNYLRWELSEGQLWYWDPVDTVTIEGDMTLIFKLHYPYVRLPALLWGTHTAIFNVAMRHQHEDTFGFAIADGTGPFQMTSWSRERITAQRWTGYPGVPAKFLKTDPQPNITGIEWISILNEQDRLDALRRGDIHVLHSPPLDSIPDLATDPAYTVIEYLQASNAYLALNWDLTEYGFNDLRVRRAFSLAIDRERLVRDALMGHGVPTYSAVPPDDIFYDGQAAANANYDRQAAHELMQAAGWHIDENGIQTRDGIQMRLECVCQDDAIHRRIAEGVRDQLVLLGVQLDLRFEKPFEAFYDAVGKHPAVSLSKWLWQDPIDALIGFCATRGKPFPNWQNASIPALDAAFTDWLQAENAAALQSAANRVQTIIAAELPYIPLLTPSDVWVFTHKLKGFRPFPANLYPFYHTARLES